MQRIWLHSARASAASLLVWQFACNSVEPSTKPDPNPNPNPNPNPPTPATPEVPTAMAVTPSLAATGTRGVTAFSAVVAGVSGAVSLWSVNNSVGGSAQLGTISSTGVYTAPNVIPYGDSVVVSAVLQADPTKRATSTVFFKPDNRTSDYYVAIPRVVDATKPAPTRFLLVPPSTAATVSFVPTSGPTVLLSPIGAGVLTFTLDATAATNGYITGTLHNLVGQLDYRTASGASVKLTGLTVNVRDAGMPDVAVTAHRRRCAEKRLHHEHAPGYCHHFLATLPFARVSTARWKPI